MRKVDVVTKFSTANSGLVELEIRMREKLRGHVRDLELLFVEYGLVLRSLARTYHAKQLAQHFLMTETPMPILANEIEVI